MKIVWDNLKEVQSFIDQVGLDRLSQNEKEWAGLGFIITGRDICMDSKSIAKRSYTIHNTNYIVVTPCWKELSWLFRNTCLYPEYKNNITYSQFQQCFWEACSAYIAKEKNYTAKELIAFVIRSLARLDIPKQASNTNGMTIEEAREAEKEFNEQLRIFKEIAAMNRK